MWEERPIYVIDTNILVDYVDIISEEPDKSPEEPTIDLTGAHIVIPAAVIRELSSFKKEKSDRGKAARTALKRIRALAEEQMQTIEKAYSLQAPIEITQNQQLISILPVHKDFKKALPFNPTAEDMDGQIILATLTVMFLKNGLPIDGSADIEKVMKLTADDVTLLTNDNGLAIRARERGILTSRYGYKYPEPYTGRRDVVVPPEIFNEFFTTRKLSREYWEAYMPESTPKLIANEFIIMSLANEGDYPRDFDFANNPYFDHIGRYDVDEDAIVALKYLRNFPLRARNAGQAIYAEALSNPEFAAVICTGPAGSGKTFMATVYGYNACKNGEFIGVTVVPCESHSKLGALPGDLDEKMDPDVQPLKNALRNYLLLDDPKLKKGLNELRKFGATNKPKNGEDDPPQRRFRSKPSSKIA